VAELKSDFLGSGWAFPVKPDAAGKVQLISGTELVRQSIWIILSTSQGERQMRPEFGCGLHELVFEANTAALQGLVQQKVRDALTRWEPRIDVMDVRSESPPERKNLLLIRVDYRIRANNSFYNLVYPFFLNEGASG
jgi:phage baseplate assembly protein W